MGNRYIKSFWHMDRYKEKVISKWLEFLGIENGETDRFVEFMDAYEYIEIARPFILRDIENRVARSVIIDRYNITLGQYRGIAKKANIYRKAPNN